MSKDLSLKILFVDDEPNILEGIKRQLRGKFNVEIAVGAQLALEALKEKGPFAVVVSDMRMPTMDGGEFLAETKKISSETVRIMLTGNADQDSAVRAVNQGNIFRFLNKPCSTEDLSQALDDALGQYKLITAEKDLLQNTLSGSIKLLTDILSFTDPISFGDSLKLREAIKKVLPLLGLSNGWEIELAAMMSNIGVVTVPYAVLEKHRKKQNLQAAEKELIDKIPSIGEKLLANIPRLENAAKIVLYQDRQFDGGGLPLGDKVKGEDIPVGSRIIKVLKDLLKLEAEGLSSTAALDLMKGRNGFYDLKIFAVVAKVFAAQDAASKEKPETKIYEITSSQLFLGQTLLSNVETREGVLLLTAGSVITEALLERLRNYAKFVGIKEPIRVDCLMPIEKGQ